MKCDFSDKYEQLTPKNQKLFRAHLVEKFDWNATTSFYNMIYGRTSISEIEKDYIENLFAEYFEQQRNAMTYDTARC